MEKSESLSHAIVIFQSENANSTSNINLCELAAAFHASQLVLAAMLPGQPSVEQVLMFTNAAALNDLKNSIRK